MKNPDDLGLTKAEWTVILDVMNGHLCMEDEHGNALFAYRDECLPNVEDGIRLERVDERHDCHGDVLLTKLHALTDEDWEVVKAVVEGFWKLTDDPNRSWIPGRK